MIERKPLARLLRPQSVVIVGASAEPMSVGHNVAGNLEKFGYAGEVHLVSRKGGEIGGRACVTSIDELPYGIDAAVLVVPAGVVQESLAACARRGIGGAIVFASGFSEQDEEGRLAQEAFARTAVQNNLAVIGPNCIGLVNYAACTPLTFEPVDAAPPCSIGVCVIAQSGAMAGNVRYALQGRGIAVSHSISTGNEAVVAAEDCLELLIDDPAVSCFALFVEQIRRPQNFLALAARARLAGKPIVLLHSGRSVRAREAAKTHTGSLAGDYAIMRAFVEREGVLLVEGLDELFDACALLAANPAHFAAASPSYRILAPCAGSTSICARTSALQCHPFHLPPAQS